MSIAILFAAASLGLAALAAEVQERTRRSRLAPADRAKVARFLASRRAAA
jgi:hypothetical protein